jgi:hypothetical protein
MKVGSVLAGYAVAFLAATVAVWFRVLLTQGNPDVQASSGMHAFADFLLFLGVFGVGALLPTGLGLYFLRPFPRLWTAVSITALATACTSPAAVAVLVLTSPQPADHPAWVLASFVALLRMAGGPLLAAAYMIAALFAPTRRSRWLLVGATGIESVIGLLAFVHWFVSRLP